MDYVQELEEKVSSLKSKVETLKSNLESEKSTFESCNRARKLAEDECERLKFQAQKDPNPFCESCAFSDDKISDCDIGCEDGCHLLRDYREVKELAENVKTLWKNFNGCLNKYDPIYVNKVKKQIDEILNKE